MVLQVGVDVRACCGLELLLGLGDGTAPSDFSTIGVEPPVQLTVSAGGAVTTDQGGTNPFSLDTLAVLGATRGPTTTELDDYRIRVSPRPDRQVQVTAFSLEGYDAETAALRRSLLIGGLVIAALEAAMAWWLASRLVRPLAAMGATANRIADGALETDIRHAGGSLEVTNLATAIDRMVSRLGIALTERERSTAEAVQARDDMKKFLADVSHEIRTPLTALTGYSELYEAGMLIEPGAVDRAMSRVGSESVRLHRLATSMMELVRGGEARAPVVIDIDAAQVVQAVVDDVRAANQQRPIDLQIIRPNDATLAGDPDRIHQAVLNLVANACTHTPAATPIDVVLESTPAALTVSVIDHGPGIDEAERQQIFLPFYRVDPSRARAGASGAGLGLAVAQQIAEEHHGSIDLQPTPGGGATFALRLPRSRREA